MLTDPSDTEFIRSQAKKHWGAINAALANGGDIETAAKDQIEFLDNYIPSLPHDVAKRALDIYNAESAKQVIQETYFPQNYKKINHNIASKRGLINWLCHWGLVYAISFIALAIVLYIAGYDTPIFASAVMSGLPGLRIASRASKAHRLWLIVAIPGMIFSLWAIVQVLRYLPT